MKLDVSVIVPVYNSGNLLRDSIKSLRAQDYDKSKMEVILINDASDDITAEVVQDLISRDHGFNVRLYNNIKNMGASYSRNLGVANSRGKYFFFLDSDDLFHENCVSACVSYFQKGAGFVFSDHASMYAGGTFETKDDNIKSIKRKNEFDLNAFLETGDNEVGAVTAVRREDFIPFREIPVAEDTAWVFDIAFAGTKFSHVPKVLYYWRRDLATIGERNGVGSLSDRVGSREHCKWHDRVVANARKIYAERESK